MIRILTSIMCDKLLKSISLCVSHIHFITASLSLTHSIYLLNLPRPIHCLLTVVSLLDKLHQLNIEVRKYVREYRKARQLHQLLLIGFFI